jgi:hypothetical protein
MKVSNIQKYKLYHRVKQQTVTKNMWSEQNFFTDDMSREDGAKQCTLATDLQ